MSNLNQILSTTYEWKRVGVGIYMRRKTSYYKKNVYYKIEFWLGELQVE